MSTILGCLCKLDTWRACFLSARGETILLLHFYLLIPFRQKYYSSRVFHLLFHICVNVPILLVNLMYLVLRHPILSLKFCFQDISADVYSSLLKALQMLDKGDTSCYPVRASGAGAIIGLLDVGFQNQNWMMRNM